VQNNIAGDPPITGISFLNFTPRLSYLPFEPFGSGWLKGAIEPGVEGWFQYYLEPRVFTAAGLKAALRYHFIGLGPLVPYLEAAAGAGGTNLNVREIRSRFTFVLDGGAGVSYFVVPGGGHQPRLPPSAHLQRQHRAPEPRSQLKHRRPRRFVPFPLKGKTL